MFEFQCTALANGSARPLRISAGFSLVECMLAIAILSITVLAVLSTTNAGHAHLHLSDRALRATSLGEDLLEEILGRPYSGTGASRPTYCLMDYDGFEEMPGDLRNLVGSLYPSMYQVYTRSAKINDATIVLEELDGASVEGKTLQIVVEDASGQRWELIRFIPEPTTP